MDQTSAHIATASKNHRTDHGETLVESRGEGFAVLHDEIIGFVRECEPTNQPLFLVISLPWPSDQEQHQYSRCSLCLSAVSVSLSLSLTG
jgi:hypothetical protein